MQECVVLSMSLLIAATCHQRAHGSSLKATEFLAPVLQVCLHTHRHAPPCPPIASLLIREIRRSSYGLAAGTDSKTAFSPIFGIADRRFFGPVTFVGHNVSRRIFGP